jgi:hypothetical protein
MRYILLPTLVVLLSVSEATAQRAVPNRWMSDGEVETIQPEKLTLESAPLRVRMSDVVYESPDPLYDGILIGAGIGALVSFALLELITEGDTEGSRWIPYGLVLGGILGLIIDSKR